MDRVLLVATAAHAIAREAPGLIMRPNVQPPPEAVVVTPRHRDVAEAVLDALLETGQLLPADEVVSRAEHDEEVRALVDVNLSDKAARDASQIELERVAAQRDVLRDLARSVLRTVDGPLARARAAAPPGYQEDIQRFENALRGLRLAVNGNGNGNGN